MLALLVLTTLGHADPSRHLARTGEALTERTWWTVDAFDEGPARPKWKNRRGLWRCWTFPDGIAARCIGRKKGAKVPFVDRHFDGGGRPTTSLSFDESGAWTEITVHGTTEAKIDVRAHHEVVLGSMQFSGPTLPSEQDGPVHWALPDGSLDLRLAEASSDVFDPAFTIALRERCACVIEDRTATWLGGVQAVRHRIRIPDPDHPRVAEIWALPDGDRVLVATWTTSAEGSLDEVQARLAPGRAWLSLTQPAPENPGGTP